MNYIGFIVAIVAVFLYTFYSFSATDENLASEAIEVISFNDNVESTLEKYKKIIGDDIDGYRNHIYRVLSYTMHFLHGERKYLPQIAVALVFHDIGLWTDSTLAYLEPSSNRAVLEGKGKFNEDDMNLIKSIVYWHHKITSYDGPHADIVNAVRKSDWIDATMGVVTYGMPKLHINSVSQAIPNAGFHATLMNFGPRLYGSNLIRIVTELSSIFKW